MIQKNAKFVLCSVLASLTLLVTVGSAHSTGFTYEVSQGDYFVDIGANRMEIVPNELTLFEFNLYPKSDPNRLADYDSVYVTISDVSQGVIYAGAVHSPGPDMLTVMSYSFPDGGVYEMSARFDKENQTLAEVVFTVPVSGGGLNNYYSMITAVAAVFLVVGMAAFWYKHKN